MNAGKRIDRESAGPGNKRRFASIMVDSAFNWPITEVILWAAAFQSPAYETITLLNRAFKDRYFEVMK